MNAITRTSAGKSAKRVKSLKAIQVPRVAPVEDSLTLMRDMVDYYRTHREEGRELLVQAGIYTKSGKLTKAYGG